MSISKEEVIRIAELVKLEFEKEEIDDFTEKLSLVLQYIDKLKEIDTDTIQPTYYPHKIKGLMREDVVKKSLTKENVLSNALDKQDGYFKIPRILEE
jgi:aspartyl-tRNA(Asn)/glutamyl-tRNA(Gln) amidotransferase subunit C